MNQQRNRQRVGALKRVVRSVAGFVIAGLSLLATPAAAQPQDQNMARHPLLVEGLLPNGLRYMIQPTKIGGMDFRLLVKAGSFDETEQERGFAHFVEHLAFRKTSKYADGDINQFIRRLGLNFGQHLNAFTTYDRTGYFLSVPENKRQEAGDEALGIIREWASRVQFDDSLVNPERGVVQAEKRVRDQQHEDIHGLRKMIYSQAEYSREVIGTDQTLANANAEGLRRFYQKHYTAERMTVVIAGQLTHDTAYWVKQIQTLFGDVPRGSGVPKRPVFEITPRVRTMAVEYGSNYVVDVSSFQRSSVAATLGDARRELINNLANSILTRRINRSANQQAGMTSSGVRDIPLADDARMFDVSLGVTSADQIPTGMALIKQEFGQLRSQPPGNEEVNLAKQEVFQRARNGVAEEDKAQPAAVAGTLVNVASSGGYYVSASQWLQFVQAVLPSIRPQDISDSLGRRIASRDWLLVAMSPKGTGRAEAAPPAMAKLLEGFGDRPTQTAARPQRPLDQLKLLSQLPSPGHVVNEQSLPYGVTEWTLSNGMRVLFKSMAQQSNDRVVLQMVRRDGTYALRPEEVPVARLAAAGAWSVSGIGELDDDEVTRFFSGKTVTMNPYAGESTVGVNGMAVNADLESLFQSVYAFMRAPRYQPVLIDKLKQTSVISMKSGQTQPEFLAGQAWRQARIGAWPQLDAIDPELLNGVSLDALTALHTRSYGNAAEFTVAITGNLDLPKVRALVERYLASLPGKSGQQAVQWLVNPIEKTGVRVERKDNPAQRMRVVLRYANPELVSSAKANVLAFMASQVLAERVRNALREQAGLAYSPSVRLWVWDLPFRGSVLNIEATVDPAQSERAQQIMAGVTQDMLSRPVTDSELQAARAAYAQSQIDLDRNPSQVAGLLARSRLVGESLSDWLAARDLPSTTDNATLQAFIYQALRGVAPSVLSFGPAQ